MDVFITRFTKHANAKSNLPPPKAARKAMNISIVKKEIDSKGNEHLKSETINYKIDLSNVQKAKNVDRPGAQLLALKQTLKDKIFSKRRAEHEKRLKEKIENEEENVQSDEEEEILEDEEIEDEEEEGKSKLFSSI